MVLLDLIHDFLETQTIAGGATGWELYKGFLPDTADKSVAIFESPGLVPENDSTNTSFYPAFQVRVRGDAFGYEVARAKMQEIRGILNDANITNLVYVYANQSGPTPLGNDGNDRPNFTLNFRTREA